MFGVGRGRGRRGGEGSLPSSPQFTPAVLRQEDGQIVVDNLGSVSIPGLPVPSYVRSLTQEGVGIGDLDDLPLALTEADDGEDFQLLVQALFDVGGIEVAVTLDSNIVTAAAAVGDLGLTFNSFASGEASGAKLAEIVGGQPDSTFSLVSDDGARVALSGRRLLRGLTALTGPANRSIVLRETFAGGGHQDSTIPYTVRVAPAVPGGLIATTLQSSVTYRGATYYFSVPVLVGYYANGEPFVLSDRAFSITRITPDSVELSTTAWNEWLSATQPAVPRAAGEVLLWINGAMPNPFFTDRTDAQGFSGFMSRAGNSNQKSANQIYTHALNVDPRNGANPYAVAVGQETSIVKSIHNTALTAPSSVWKQFENWSVLHVVAPANAPATGAFPPAVCSLSKASRFHRSQLNKACLPGFTPSAGFPTLAATLADDSYLSGFFPHFGHLSGELRRRYYLHEGYSGGSDGFGSRWASHIAALLSAGPSVADADLDRIVHMGLQFFGMAERGFRGNAGAGQGCGHAQVCSLIRFLFPDHPGLDVLVWDFKSNARSQPYWGELRHVGLPTSWPGNHDRLWLGVRPGDVGRPLWVAGGNNDGPAPTNPNLDGVPNQDYEVTSGLGSFVERLNIGLLVNGPGGIDGATHAVEGKGWGVNSPGAAMFAYNDRYRTYYFDLNNPGPFSGSVNIRAYYDDRRDDIAMPRWTGVPDAMIPDSSSRWGTFLTAGSGSFTWNWTNLAGATEPVLEWQTQWSYSGVQWFDVTTQGVSGTQSGLIPGVKHLVRYRRRSASGWSEWSNNYPYTSGGADRFAVTPTGTPSGTVTSLVAPSFAQKRNARSSAPDFEAAAATMEAGKPIFIGWGRWSGNLTGAPTLGVEVEQTLNAGDWVAAPASTIVTEGNARYFAARKQDAGKRVRPTAAWGGVTVQGSPILIGALPAIPDSTIIDWDGSYASNLLYEDVLASFDTNLNGISAVQRNPTATYFGNEVSEDVDLELLASATIVGLKNNQNPTLQGNIAATKPLTPGHTYRLEVDVAYGVIATGGDKRTWAGAVLGWQLGTAVAGSDIKGYATHSVADQPNKVTLTYEFIAGTGVTTCFLRVRHVTNTAGNGGGNPLIDAIRMERIA